LTPLWTLKRVLEAVEGRAVGPVAASFGGISIDSRQISPRDLFVAIRGDRFDGHDFVEKAIAAGAGAALVSTRVVADLPANLPLIVVTDAFEGLYGLARAARARTEAKIIAITGSAGKTSTKEMVRVALEALGETHASIKSFNNHWGVPLMVARMPAGCEFGVFEVGMNHVGEIAPLSKLLRPDISIITGISEAHIENFAGLAGIARAKGEIFEGMAPGGLALLGADHGHVGLVSDLAERAGQKIVTYGFADDADIEVFGSGVGGQGGQVVVGGDRYPLEMAQAGRHALANGAAALAVVSHLGGDMKKARKAVEACPAGPGRGVIHRLAGDIILVDESYNANPASMGAALEVFGAMKGRGGRRILVLGEMLELGQAGAGLHLDLARPVLGAQPDKVFLVGEGLKKLAKALPGNKVGGWFETEGAARRAILNLLAPGDLIMVKGSNGVGLGALVLAIVAGYK
jgi:UDP-N-acetylmuramoyl-tripeptide--D-alanyl-D-alanine ligase